MTERELARGAARRLAIIRHAHEVSGNVARTCRYYGITRQSYYTWLRRYEEGGIEALRDRSRRPHVSPNATKAEVVGKIVYLTEEEAKAAVQRHRDDQGFSMVETRPEWSSYRCPSCKAWHITSGPGWPSWFGKRLHPHPSTGPGDRADDGMPESGKARP